MIFSEPVTEPVTEPLTELITEPFNQAFFTFSFTFLSHFLSHFLPVLLTGILYFRISGLGNMTDYAGTEKDNGFNYYKSDSLSFQYPTNA